MPLVVEEMPPETIGGSGETHFPSGKPLKQKPCLHGWPMVKQPFLGSVVATGKTKKKHKCSQLSWLRMLSMPHALQIKVVMKKDEED